MQMVYLSILLATVASVFCTPHSTLLSNVIENSGEPFSDSAILDNDLPVSSSPAPSFSQPLDEIAITTAAPFPVLVIQMEDDRNRTDVQTSVDEAFGDRVVRWLVVAKTTHIDRVEEISDDFLSGKKKKVSSENRFEQLQMLRDSKHAFFGNEFDLTSVFK